MVKFAIKTILVTAFVLCGIVIVYFGQKYYFLRSPTQLVMWNQFDEQSKKAIDHSLWQKILDNYLVADSQKGMTLFRYSDVSKTDDQVLDSYLYGMSQIDPREYNRAEQMAYWINLYNALTVDLIIDVYPVKSIKEVGSRIQGIGPWDDPIIRVANQSLTLNDIEHRILRAIWKDNRIHYGLNCASIGCPNLYHKAFTGDSVSEQLELAGRDYVAHPRAVRFEKDQLVLSSIYRWFSPDFGSNQREVIQHIAQFAEKSTQAKLMQYDGKVSYEYNWQLNDFLGTADRENNE